MEERRVADSVKVLFVMMMMMMMMTMMLMVMTIMIMMIAVMMITIMMVGKDEDCGGDNIWRIGELMVGVVAAVVRVLLRIFIPGLRFSKPNLSMFQASRKVKTGSATSSPRYPPRT